MGCYLFSFLPNETISLECDERDDKRQQQLRSLRRDKVGGNLVSVGENETKGVTQGCLALLTFGRMELVFL